MVHRANKEVATECSRLPAGSTREVQRNSAAARIAAECKEARKERKRQKTTTWLLDEFELIKSRNKLVASQIKLYTENKATCIATMGEEAYNNKILELLRKLPDPENVRIHDEDTGGGEEEEGDNENDDEDSEN